MRQIAAALLFLAAVSVPSARATYEMKRRPDPEKAEQVHRKAMRLWSEGRDLAGALAAFDEAVELDPENVEIRLHRGTFFLGTWPFVAEESREAAKASARRDFEWVARRDPQSIAAGIARDALSVLEGRSLFPPEPPPCSAEGGRALREAETSFVGRDYEKALLGYERAAQACPENFAILAHYGDAHFQLRQYGKARGLYLRAVAANPWYAKGHRFLADAEMRLGMAEAAFRSAVRAVVAEPTYEAGWAALQAVAELTNRRYLRVYGEKTLVRRSAGAEGEKIEVRIPQLNNRKSSGAKKGGEDPEAVAWMAYGLVKAAVLVGAAGESGAEGDGRAGKVKPALPSAREIERKAVEGALAIVAEAREKGDAEPLFWAMMRRASEGGVLEEAIFIHLLDEELLAEYRSFREKQADRLVAYVETFLAPEKEP